MSDLKDRSVYKLDEKYIKTMSSEYVVGANDIHRSSSNKLYQF